jgi:hypothetical protein
LKENAGPKSRDLFFARFATTVNRDCPLAATPRDRPPALYDGGDTGFLFSSQVVNFLAYEEAIYNRFCLAWPAYEVLDDV